MRLNALTIPKSITVTVGAVICRDMPAKNRRKSPSAASRKVQQLDLAEKTATSTILFKTFALRTDYTIIFLFYKEFGVSDKTNHLKTKQN